jgi:hypothetical protein
LRHLLGLFGILLKIVSSQLQMIRKAFFWCWPILIRLWSGWDSFAEPIAFWSLILINSVHFLHKQSRTVPPIKRNPQFSHRNVEIFLFWRRWVTSADVNMISK